MTTADSPSKAAIYLRVSTDPQAESIPGQERDLRELCESKGWRIVARFEDAGLTGTNDRRPEFQRMLKEARSKSSTFDQIVIWDTTRFGRSVTDLVNLQHLLDNDVRVYGFREGYYLDPNDIRTVVGNFTARDDITRKRLATPRGQRESVRRGLIGSGLGSLFGYKSEFRTTSGKPRRYLVPDSETAPIVRQLFKRFLAGDAIRDLARWLNTTGVPTQAVRLGKRRGKKPKGLTYGRWQGTTVRSILSNPHYTGYLVYGRQTSKVTLEGTRKMKDAPADRWTWSEKPSFEALVSKEHFAKTQAKLKEPSRFRDRGGPPNFVLGLGRCKACDGPISLEQHGSSKGKPPVHYFYCRQKRELKKGDKRCAGGFRYDFVKGRVTVAVSLLLSDERLIQKSVKQYNTVIEDYEGNGEMNSVETRINRLKKEERNLLEAIKSGADLESVRDELSKVAIALQQALGQRENLQRELAQRVTPFDKSAVATDAKRLVSAAKNANMEGIKRLLPSLVSRITFDFTMLPVLKTLKSLDLKLVKAGIRFNEAGQASSFDGDNDEAAMKVFAALEERNNYADAVKGRAVSILLRYDPTNLEALGQEALESVGTFASARR